MAMNIYQRLKSGFMEQYINNALVHPCVINGIQALVYPCGIERKKPQAFRVIHHYAHVNGHQYKEDQRSDFLEGIKRIKDKKLANVVSVLAVSTGLALMSQPAAAAEKKGFKHPFVSQPAVIHNISDHDVARDAYQTEAELAQLLMDWLAQHSSFDISDIQAPTIKKASSFEIASVAFGGRIPKAINPDNLRIFGLYNFNEKAVYLLDSVDLETIKGKSILLHELVHYLQYETGIDKKAKCINELEALAYLLEARFLDKHHHRHGITHDHIDKISQCRG